jgi:putative ABC transport system permease protein
MQGRLRNLGGGLLMVSPNRLPTAPGRPRQLDHFISLDADDARALTAQLPQLQQAVPVAARDVTVRLGARALRVRLVGTTPEYLRVRGFSIARGRFFAPVEENRRVVVLGHAVSAELRSQDTLPDQEMCVGATAYRIVGVLAPQGLNFAGEDEDRQVFVPLETYRCQIAHRPWVDALYLQLSPEANSAQAMRQVEQVLRDRHGRWSDQVPDVVVRDFADLAAQQANLLATITWAVSITSGLLVLMGSVGIATLMLLVVRQRRVEIGLRRALGATPTDVGLQFFTEGIVLAAAGVLVGLGLGIGVAVVLGGVRAVPVQIDPMLVLVSAAFSLGAGTAACAIPALLAARLDPGATLRS